jgi:hypothetical protein
MAIGCCLGEILILQENCLLCGRKPDSAIPAANGNNLTIFSKRKMSQCMKKNGEPAKKTGPKGGKKKSPKQQVKVRASKHC